MAENTLEEQIQIEDGIIELLSTIWKMYDNLPELHPMDKAMFHEAIHKAQAIILARPKMRGILLARQGQPQSEQQFQPREASAQPQPTKIDVPPGQKAAPVAPRGTAGLPPIASPLGN